MKSSKCYEKINVTYLVTPSIIIQEYVRYKGIFFQIVENFITHTYLVKELERLYLNKKENRYQWERVECEEVWYGLKPNDQNLTENNCKELQEYAT